MTSKELPDVTLALVDPTLLSCWEEMVKRGEECTLMLKHSKGQVTATLQSTKQTSILPVPSLSSSASAKKKKKKGNKKKRVEALLAYHQRLVEEKGLPPSRLMLQQAAAAATSPSSSSTLSQSPGTSEMSFKCDLCDFTSKSKRGLKVHTGRSHKEKDQQMPVESLRGEEHENSLDISQLSETRDKDSSLVNADHSEISSSSTPVKEINDSVSDRSDDEDEDDGWVHPMRRAASPGPHKCPPFHPCSKPECRKKWQR